MTVIDQIRVRRSDVLLGAIAAAVALIAGILVTMTGNRLLLAVAALVIVAILFPRLRLWITLAGATIPLSGSIGVRGGGVFIAACDVFAMVALASFLLIRKNHPPLPEGEVSSLRGLLLRPVKPGLILLGVYVATAALNAYLVNPQMGTWVTIAQRAELIGVWMLLGVCAYMSKTMHLALGGFVAAAALQAAVWITTPGVKGVLGAQKNPSGGFIAAAILIVLLASIPNRYRVPLLILLTGGLIATGSRGSIIGLAAALVVLLFFVRQWGRVILPLVAITTAGYFAIQILPDAVTDRLFSETSSGVYNANIRDVFVRDAMYQFNNAPWSGVGVGNYEQITRALSRVETHDPHNVFVLALVEGGYPLGIAFALLVGGTLIWLLRKPKTSLVVLALVVQISTLVHAYVDVYWVRGTPVAGWMLIGAAAASAYQWNRGRSAVAQENFQEEPSGSIASARR